MTKKNQFEESFIDAFEQGASARALKEKFKIDNSFNHTLYGKLRDQNKLSFDSIHFRKAKGFLRDNKAVLIEMFSDGIPMKKIAKKFKKKTFIIKTALSLHYKNDPKYFSNNAGSMKSVQIDLYKAKKKKDLVDKRKASYSTGRNREIIELRNKGKTLQEIGDKYDLSRERVRQIIKKIVENGPYEDMVVLTDEEISAKYLENNKKQRDSITQIEIKPYRLEIINLYKKGLPESEISKLLHLDLSRTRKFIKYLIDRDQIKKIRIRRASSRKEGVLTKEDRDIIYKNIIAFRKEGKKLDYIANLLGYSKARISQFIREMRDAGYIVPDHHNMANRHYVRDWDKINTRSKIILDMMKKGKKRYEIADVLGVDAGSISRHVRNYLKDEIDKL